MREALLKQDVIHAYETTVKLLNWRRPKKKDKDKDKGKGKNKALNVGGKPALPAKRPPVTSGFMQRQFG